MKPVELKKGSGHYHHRRWWWESLVRLGLVWADVARTCWVTRDALRERP